MKELYLECAMGASGDMLMGALYDICPDPAAFLDQMAALDLPGVHLHAQRGEKLGIAGISMTVHVHGQEEASCDAFPGHGRQSDRSHAHEHEHEHGPAHNREQNHEPGHGHGDQQDPDRSRSHVHSSMESVRALIGKTGLSAAVRENALAVYELLAEAEAAVHGTAPELIHFHEVGALDALADILGCCLLMEQITPDRITCSPVCVGGGQVHCAHGILPVPAPATARILTGVPIYGGDIRGELCTPTGAALLRHFATEFGPMPPMTLERVGYGLGKKDFPAANCLRAIMGRSGGSATRIAELRCNIDDMTGEALGVAMDILMKNGALDVFFTPIQMKKNRPAVLLTCLCAVSRQQEFTQLLLTHTSTLGVRSAQWDRTVLSWRTEERRTPYGPVRVKVSEGYGLRKVKPEFDDVTAAALGHGVPFEAVFRAAMKED